jgi:hypothetical protein
MSTKMGFWRFALAGTAMLLMCSSAASARTIEAKGITTIEKGAILVYMDLELDVDEAGIGTDTRVQLTNTSDFLTRVDCFYINANSHCGGNGGPVCTSDGDCVEQGFPGLRCLPGWAKTDFRLTLTKRQPLSWNLGNGLSRLPLANVPSQDGQFNEGSIPPAPENPFIGELRCIQKDVGDPDRPSDRNDLKGEMTVVTTSEGGDIDARKANAIAIKAIEGAQDGDLNVLNIGGPDAEYGSRPADGQEGNVGCPNIWTVNHFFEGAEVVSHEGTVNQNVSTKLTVVPCSANLLNDLAGSATLQFLIYNEFEQRFSTSTSVDCYRETRLADIDTRPGVDGDNRSIFSVGTQGTLTGMSRVRSVSGRDDNEDNYDGHGVLLQLEELWGLGTCSGGATTGEFGHPMPAEALCAVDSDCGTDGVCMAPVDGLPYKTTAANVQFQGNRSQGDRIVLP